MPEGSNAAAAAGLSLATRNLYGIIAMTVSAGSFTINDAFVKTLGASLPSGEIMALRGVLSTLMLAALAAWAGCLRLPLDLVRRPAFGWRLVGEVAATTTFVVSLMHIRFADANGIQQFQPLALTAVSAVVLGSQVGWRRWLAALAGLLGVLLIIKPGTSGFSPYALVSASCVGFVVLRDLATRAIPAHTPSLLLALTSSAAVMLMGAAMGVTETWVTLTPEHWLALLGAAVFLVGGYYMVTYSVRTGEITVVAPFRYTSVVFAVLLQLGVWGTLPDTWSLVGITIVALAGLYTFHRERIRMAEARRTALAEA